MVCHGGIDFNDCEMPEFCHPAKGPMGKEGHECPAFCPVKCDAKDLQCWGGMDENDCPKPDFCLSGPGKKLLVKIIVKYMLSIFFTRFNVNFMLVPNSFCIFNVGPIGNDGKECPLTCPVICKSDEMWCDGGIDHNGCMMPNTCVNSKGPMGKDNVECNAFCPVKCAPGDMQCWGGKDDYDCEMPGFCTPSKGTYNYLVFCT